MDWQSLPEAGYTLSRSGEAGELDRGRNPDASSPMTGEYGLRGATTVRRVKLAMLRRGRGGKDAAEATHKVHCAPKYIFDGQEMSSKPKFQDLGLEEKLFVCMKCNVPDVAKSFSRM